MGHPWRRAPRDLLMTSLPAPAVGSRPAAFAFIRDPRAWVLPLACVLVFLSRAAFLPPTLEDIDSVNFARALDQFDPSLHQPHPPGYPVYVVVARLVHGLVPDPPKALALLSAMSQALLVLPLFALFQGLGSTPFRAALAALLVLACPVLWFNGARPMSDSLGLLFVVSTQALLLRALHTGGHFSLASLLAGLSLGVRLQTGLLTIPLWLWVGFKRRGGAAPFVAFAAGALAWALPMLFVTGGPGEYARAFAEIMDDAARSEPVLVGLTLNHAVRALHDVLAAPWVSQSFGVFVVLFSALGFLETAIRRRDALGLALLAYGPYLVFHTLVHQVETVRYSLPYIPGIVWMAVAGVGILTERLPKPRFIQGTLVIIMALAAAAITVPALALYHVTSSPPAAALRAVEARAVPPHTFVLAGHYMFWRYFPLRPEGLELLRAESGHAVPRVVEHLLTGDTREILFLADPGRTDLVSFSRESRHLVGRWQWPPEVRPFLKGERPNQVELFAIRSPRHFPGDGWLLSLESGRIDDAPLTPRLAYLKATSRPSFLLVAGSPTDATEDCHLDLEISGLLSDRAPCLEPLLRGYRLDASDPGSGYLPLSITTAYGDSPVARPFVLDGLDYGAEDDPGFARGEGWFHPEKDNEFQRFYWTSPHARTLLHVPPSGVRLVIEGTAPVRYLGAEFKLELTEGGAPLAATQVKDGRFRLEAQIPGTASRFREVLLTSERSFVPDAIQKNGDLRHLAVRVYSFSLVAVGSQPR